MPVNAPSVAQVAFAYRWLSVQMAAHPDIPEEALRCYFECEAAPTVADLQDALGCDDATAAGWLRVLAVRLIHPGHYPALFDAEDAVSQCQQQQQRYQDDVRTTTQRLAELQQQIEATLAYHHSLADGGEQAELQARLDALDEERVALLRHQGDLPGTGRLIAQAVAEAQAALSAAQTTLAAVQVEQLQAVEETWLAELLDALEPAVRLLTQAQWLTQAWQKQGREPGREHGQERLRAAALARLRPGVSS
jgi:hypothetical protein